MYRVEGRIPMIEIARESPFSLRWALPTTYENILDIIGSRGEIQRYDDYETNEIVFVGMRGDYFPWQAWPSTDKPVNDE